MKRTMKYAVTAVLAMAFLASAFARAEAEHPRNHFTFGAEIKLTEEQTQLVLSNALPVAEQYAMIAMPTTEDGKLRGRYLKYNDCKRTIMNPTDPSKAPWTKIDPQGRVNGVTRVAITTTINVVCPDGTIHWGKFPIRLLLDFDGWNKMVGIPEVNDFSNIKATDKDGRWFPTNANGHRHDGQGRH